MDFIVNLLYSALHCLAEGPLQPVPSAEPQSPPREFCRAREDSLTPTTGVQGERVERAASKRAREINGWLPAVELDRGDRAAKRARAAAESQPSLRPPAVPAASLPRPAVKTESGLKVVFKRPGSGEGSLPLPGVHPPAITALPPAIIAPQAAVTVPPHPPRPPPMVVNVSTALVPTVSPFAMVQHPFGEAGAAAAAMAGGGGAVGGEGGAGMVGGPQAGTRKKHKHKKHKHDRLDASGGGAHGPAPAAEAPQLKPEPEIKEEPSREPAPKSLKITFSKSQPMAPKPVPPPQMALPSLPPPAPSPAPAPARRGQQQPSTARRTQVSPPARPQPLPQSAALRGDQRVKPMLKFKLPIPKKTPAEPAQPPVAPLLKQEAMPSKLPLAGPPQGGILGPGGLPGGVQPPTPQLAGVGEGGDVGVPAGTPGGKPKPEETKEEKAERRRLKKEKKLRKRERESRKAASRNSIPPDSTGNFDSVTAGGDGSLDSD